MGLVRGYLIVRGQISISKEVQISELWKDPGPKGLRRSSEEKHQEGIGQREAKNYLRENCYHRIKCSVTNSLAALMWR